ncbi:MAG: LamG-like jellyroll fold domain-containing protein [Kiritimatiellia bacterium]
MKTIHTDKESLIAAYMAGEDVAEELLQLCRSVPSIAEELAGHLEVERLLHLNVLCEQEDLFVKELEARLQCEGDDGFVKNIEKSLKASSEVSFRRLWKFSAVAALMLSLAGWFLMSTPYSVWAVVSRQRSAVWHGRSFVACQKIRNRSLTLDEGYAELNLVNGVRLILEAPVSIEFEKHDRLILKNGSLVARVPEQATGFTVLTPSSEVVDLGTEFGVSVDDAGASELCVLDGEVKARGSREQDFVHMTKNEACAFDVQRQIRMIKSDPSRFVRALPGHSPDNPDYLHWAFDGGSDVVVCGGRGIQGRCYDGRLKAFDGGEGPLRQPGVFGKSIYFNGTDAYIETRFPGIGGHAPRTVAFWARVPEGDIEDTGYGMISWGLMKPGAAWQISPNPFEPEGPLGRIRIGTMDGFVIGTKDLRDNHWHHIAIVMYGGDAADTSTHILIYVDGALEKTSRKSIISIATRLDSRESQDLRFGRNLGFRGGNDRRKDRFFHGWLDEVYIFDAALEQQQIERLMRQNEF